jgi:tetratricopeptide (TPR) repeat protein
MTSKVYYTWGRYDEVLSNSESLLRYYHEVNDSWMQGAVLNNIARIHTIRGEYDKAVQLYNQCMEIARRLGDQQAIASTLHDIATIHDSKGEYDQAMKKYNQSLEIKRQLGDQQGIARTLTNISALILKNGGYEEALSYLLKAYTILTGLNSPELQRVIEILSYINQKLGNEEYERLVKKVQRDMSVPQPPPNSEQSKREGA